MVLIGGAVILGLIGGVLGYYFSKIVNVLSLGAMGLSFRAVDKMGTLPEHIQMAIIISVASFFAARIFTWLFLKRPQKVETKTARKKRILKEYGYKKMPDMF